MKTTIEKIQFFTIAIFALLLISACTRFPEDDEMAPAKTSSNSSTHPLNESELYSIDKDDRHTDAYLSNGLVLNDEKSYVFISNGLKVSIYQLGPEGNQGVILVEGGEDLLPENTSLFTLRMEFSESIKDFSQLFQVISGVDSISRSVEFGDSTLLTEFYPHLNESGGFSFGVYFEIERENFLMNLATLIEEVSIHPTGIELTILDDSMILGDARKRDRGSKPMLTPKFERDKRTRILEMMEFYLAGAKTSIIKKVARERRLRTQETVELDFIMSIGVMEKVRASN